MTMSSVENLKQMRARLELIQEHLPHFESIVERPPILDTHHHYTNSPPIKASSDSDSKPIGDEVLSNSKPSISGLRAFQEYVKHDIEQVDRVCLIPCGMSLQPCGPFPAQGITILTDYR